jgi:hypothetical protein
MGEFYLNIVHYLSEICMYISNTQIRHFGVGFLFIHSAQEYKPPKHRMYTYMHVCEIYFVYYPSNGQISKSPVRIQGQSGNSLQYTSTYKLFLCFT